MTAGVPPADHRDADGASGPSASGGDVVAGGAWKLASSVVPQLYVLAVSLAAARALGPTGMGRQSYISFVQATAMLLATGGIAASLMRYTAEMLGRGRPEAVAVLGRWALRRQVVAAALAIGALGAVSIWADDLQLAWTFAAVACGAGVLHSVPNSLLVGFQRWRLVSIVGLVGGAISTATTVVVLILGGGITGIFAVEAVVAILTLVAATVLARREPATRPQPSPTADAEHRGLLRAANRYAAGAWLQLVLHVVVWRRTELFVLERTAAASEIAFYSIAFSFVVALTRVPSALSATLSPAFASLHGAGAPERIRSGFERATRLLTIASLFLTAALVALGPLILATFYGDDYTRAGRVVLVLAVSFPFLPLHYIGSSLLQGVGAIRQILVANAIATAVNIAGVVALVPPFGAMGAAAANGLAQAAASLLMLAAARRAVAGVNISWPALARPALVAALAGVAAWLPTAVLSGPVALAAGGLAGLGAFAAGAALLGVLPPGDAEWVAAIARERFGNGPMVRRMVRLVGGPARKEA